MISDGKVYDSATCEIPDYKKMMDDVIAGRATETPWVDEKEWYNGRTLETFISSDAVDVQGDKILQRGLIRVMPWLNKYGFYEWHHSGYPIGHYLGWRMKDGKLQIRVGIHDSKFSNMKQHDKAWDIIQQYKDKGCSSIKGVPISVQKMPNGVREINDVGVFAVGWVGPHPANPFAEVTSVSFAKGADLKKEVVKQGDRWAVMCEGSADPIATFATKEEADATLQAIEANKASDVVKEALRAPDSLHDKIAKELYGRPVAELDAVEKATVMRRAEELLALQAEELFKERAAGRLSLAVYGELLLYKERLSKRDGVNMGEIKQILMEQVKRDLIMGPSPADDVDLTERARRAVLGWQTQMGENFRDEVFLELVAEVHTAMMGLEREKREFLVTSAPAPPQGPSSTEKEAQRMSDEDKTKEVKKEVPAPPAGGGAQAAANLESRVDALVTAVSEMKATLDGIMATQKEEPKKPDVEEKPEAPEDLKEKSAQLQKELDETRTAKAKLEKELALKKQGAGAAAHDNTAPPANSLAKAFDDAAAGEINGTQLRKQLEKRASKPKE